MTTTVDVAIIGGGIIGMALANELLDRRPSLRVVVLDKETKLGAHASGRNSGVIHAGFYYAPDSLKAQLTRRGNQMMHAFLAENDVPVRQCGKVVVTKNFGERAALETLFERGRANSVPLELLSEQDLRAIEPGAKTVDVALWSPTTSVSDPVAALTAMARQVTRKGGDVRLGSRVTGASRGSVRLATETIQVGHVVNAAGLQADRVARWFGMCDDYVVLPFKGLYWYAKPSTRLTRCHVYPVPDPANPFLGVHLTVTVDGRAKVGPTAIPALWREAYGGLAGFEAQDLGEVARNLPLFLGSPHHDAFGLVRSELPKYIRRRLIAEAAKLVPGIRPEDFKSKGRPGIRAQLFHKPTRRLEMDFVTRGDEYSTHVLNAVSPAWTSSLAVADFIVSDMEGRARI